MRCKHEPEDQHGASLVVQTASRRGCPQGHCREHLGARDHRLQYPRIRLLFLESVISKFESSGILRDCPNDIIGSARGNHGFDFQHNIQF